MNNSDYSIIVDIVGLASISSLLIVIHFILPAGFREQFSFHHAEFNAYALLTASYVHLNDAHLWGNVVGFFLAASIAYAFCYWQGRRRWFWLTTLAFLTVIPVPMELTSYAIFQAKGITSTSRGFSGVVAGYVGFILVVHARDLADRYKTLTVLILVEAVVLLLLGVLLFIYPETQSIRIVALLGLGLVATLGMVGWRGVQADFDSKEQQELRQQVVSTIAVVAILVGFTALLFPATLAQGESTTNIYGHAAGFVLGAVVSPVTLWFKV